MSLPSSETPKTGFLVKRLILDAVLAGCVPILFGVLGRMWHSIVSVPEVCHFNTLLNLVPGSSLLVPDSSNWVLILVTVSWVPD